MTKAGEKLIAAAKEARQAARCRHKWMRLSTMVRERQVVGQTDLCEKCGVRRTSYVSHQQSTPGESA